MIDRRFSVGLLPVVVVLASIDVAPIRVPGADAPSLEECTADGVCVADSPADDPLPDTRAVTVLEPHSDSDGEDVVEAARIVSPWRVDTPQALKAEIIAAESALSLRAEVDGPPAVYDSPSVSIALRKVSPETLANEWVELKSPDGADLKIPPGAKQMHGGPVTITITSYHTGGRVKQLPGRVKYGKNRELRRKLGGEEAISGTRVKEDRVDFFLMKDQPKQGPARHSVSWAGTVDVKVRDPTKGRGKIKNGYEHGLGISVPAHDRDWVPGAPTREEASYPEERQALQMEVESLVGKPAADQQRGYRRLAKRWHPDKNPEEREKATVLFEFLGELRERLFDG